ncbi:MAG: radical SAM protein [Bacillota bacterium]|nr:radical SAM protein [Bacillota bacterium]
MAGELGFCRAGALPAVAKACLHQWEEPPISGTRGSGTVFFSRCNLRCVFCQNHPISQGGVGVEVSVERLAEIFLEQQARGAHNLNLVSPTPYLPQVGQALELARAQGLDIPVVWNSNGYESAEALARLEGLVNVYLPDFKYADAGLAARLSGTGDYPTRAAAAIREMVRQVGETEFNGDGLVRRGVILRHLVLPGEARNTRAVLDWVRDNLPAGIYVSLMAQYTPAHRTAGPGAERQFGALSRRLLPEEYEAAVDYFLEIGFRLPRRARSTPPRGGEHASSG